jgi:hypothetical protein
MYLVFYVKHLEPDRQYRRNFLLNLRKVLENIEDFLLLVYEVKKIIVSFQDKESEKILYIK